MALTINRLTNANLRMDGISHLGKVDELDLPSLQWKMTDHKALGMLGMMEFPSGIDKLEARVKWNSFYSDVFAKIANPYIARDIQVRGSLEGWEGGSRISEVPFVCFIKGAFKNFPAGNFKQHDNVEIESRIMVSYLRMEIAGVAVLEVDVSANIFKINGVDQLATYRANIGQ